MIKASPVVDLGARYLAGAHSMPKQDDAPRQSFTHTPPPIHSPTRLPQTPLLTRSHSAAPARLTAP